ncbi:hypothetical protein [Romboutsia sp. 1001713B170207_170306_H8]|uniref:hypothetical protein n=1 Tax=Romboutsia sp. 1001713B170207_170306_H8 TaxID=2787112 RepID=UPI0018998646|nr:hypothetical protein [Romboutsia sp. 1001713B170207_170306_H8]
MSNFNSIRKDIAQESKYRIMEINYMFSQLESFDGNPLDKYFLARSVVVFSYGTVEKFIKNLSGYALSVIIENEYFFNNVRDLMCIIKNKNKIDEIFDLVMHYKKNPSSSHNLDYNGHKSYFNSRDSINDKSLSHIVNVLDLNKNEPLLKIPAATMKNLCNVRMSLSHGDYINELKRFNESRQNLTIEQVDDYIHNNFKLNDKTKKDLLDLINDFERKILNLLDDIDLYIDTTKKAL